MNQLIEGASNFIHHSNFAPVFLDASLKSVLILAAAGACCVGWRRASAATRHFMWFLALLSLPCLPVLSLLLPSWQRPLWSVSASIDSGNELSLVLEFVPGGKAAIPLAAPGKLANGTGGGPGTAVRSPEKPSGILRFNARWLWLVLVAWVAGVLWLLLPIAVGTWQVRKLSRKARPVGEPNWISLLQEARDTLNWQGSVALLQSADNLMPVTWGCWHPVVLLPVEADRWPLDRQRVVLLHELAHVKRRDCLSQMIARIICALYWFNPLVWLAVRRMCVEREGACDDLVLNHGHQPSDYANHLVEIARNFRRVPQVAAIAMARSSGLERRISNIVDGSRPRQAPGIIFKALFCLSALGLVTALAAQKLERKSNSEEVSRVLRQQQIARLQTFDVAKEKQSLAFAARAGEQISPEYQTFFEAARNGDWQTVTGMYDSFKRRHPQYAKENEGDSSLRTSFWSPVLEICLAYYDVTAGEPKYIQIAIDDIIPSIPAGSIYFGGTDPGRGLITAFCKSHVDADPFFTLTQNALADGTYLEYLRNTYGGKIYTPTDKNSQTCFQQYTADAQKRLEHDRDHPNEARQLKPGEDVKLIDGRVQVSGQVAVMAINALLTKLIFDQNPERNFYIEESFPLDWMYPHLSPNGLIMKINRQPLSEVPPAVLQQDRRFWRLRVDDMIGPWLTDETPIQTIVEFVKKVHVQKDLEGFAGDPRFLANQNAQRMFSKWRSAIGGVYNWRAAHPHNPAEKQSMAREADFAFRQAFALSPSSPEPVFRYVNLLISLGRVDDAILLVEAAQKLAPRDRQFKGLIEQLHQILEVKKGKG